jgi:hypothetical protein
LKGNYDVAIVFDVSNNSSSTNIKIAESPIARFEKLERAPENDGFGRDFK